MPAKKKPQPKPYVVVMQHSNNDDPSHKVFTDKDKAHERAHKFFLNYFELRDGKPYDIGCGPDQQEGRFEDVKIVKGRVIGFSHAEGYGPSCYITRG